MSKISIHLGIVSESNLKFSVFLLVVEMSFSVKFIVKKCNNRGSRIKSKPSNHWNNKMYIGPIL